MECQRYKHVHSLVTEMEQPQTCLVSLRDSFAHWLLVTSVEIGTRSAKSTNKDTCGRQDRLWGW